MEVHFKTAVKLPLCMLWRYMGKHRVEFHSPLSLFYTTLNHKNGENFMQYSSVLKKLCLTLQRSIALASCHIIMLKLTIIALSHIQCYLASCLSTPTITLLLQFLFHPLFQGWTSLVHPEHQTLFMVSWKRLRTGTSGMTKSLDCCQNSVRCHNLFSI